MWSASWNSIEPLFTINSTFTIGMFSRSASYSSTVTGGSSSTVGSEMKIHFFLLFKNTKFKFEKKSKFEDWISKILKSLFFTWFQNYVWMIVVLGSCLFYGVESMDHARTQPDCEISKNVSNFSVFFQVAKIIQLLIQLTANSISKNLKLKKKTVFWDTCTQD